MNTSEEASFAQYEDTNALSRNNGKCSRPIGSISHFNGARAIAYLRPGVAIMPSSFSAAVDDIIYTNYENLGGPDHLASAPPAPSRYMNRLSKRKKNLSSKELDFGDAQPIHLTEDQLKASSVPFQQSPVIFSQSNLLGGSPSIHLAKARLETFEENTATKESQADQIDSSPSRPSLGRSSPFRLKEHQRQTEESLLSQNGQDEDGEEKMKKTSMISGQLFNMGGGGTSSINSSKRSGSRIIEQLENLKLNNKKQRDSNSKMATTHHRSMVERKSELLAKKSFINKLTEHDESIQRSKSQDHNKIEIARLESRLDLKKHDTMFYPGDTFKHTWDLLITFTLIFTCLVVPVRIAFVENDSTFWSIINILVDLIFLVDIFVTFNTAFFDDDLRLVQNRKKIAQIYLKTWFFIDLLAIIPFDQFSQQEDSEDTVAKLSKVYRLAKLTRLLRIMKLFKKSQGSIFKLITEFLHISASFERLFLFFLSFCLLCHISSCLWVMISQFSLGSEPSWLDRYTELDATNQYVLSVYFTVTTITTVGYGDISGENKNERLFCVFLMVIGVVSFSFASGSLSSILQNYDSQNAKLVEQVEILNKVQQDYELPLELYQRLKQSLMHNYSQDIDKLNSFLEALPQNLRIEISLHIHQDTYNNVYFMRDKPMSFIAWLCPLLKSYMATPDEYIYYEGDEIVNMFFMKKGSCGFVLPKYNNTQYINITNGCDFGTEDIIACILRVEDIDGEDWTQHRDKLIRQFTVMADRTTEMLTLSINDLNRIQTEFLETYNTLMDVACQRLEYALMIKLECIGFCEEVQEKMNKEEQQLSKNMTVAERLGLNLRKKFREKNNNNFKFQPFNMADLDQYEEYSLVYIPSEDGDDIQSAHHRRSTRKSWAVDLAELKEELQKPGQIGKIIEVKSELEESISSEGLDSPADDSRNTIRKSKQQTQNQSISSSSSFESSSFSSSNVPSPRLQKALPGIVVERTISSTDSPVSPPSKKSKSEALDRLQTILKSRPGRQSMKPPEEDEKLTTFKRLKTVIKKHNTQILRKNQNQSNQPGSSAGPSPAGWNNNAISAKFAKYQFPRKTEGNGDDGGFRERNIMSLLETNLKKKIFIGRQSVEGRSRRESTASRASMPNVNRLEKLVEGLYDEIRQQSSKIDRLEQKIEDMRFHSPPPSFRRIAAREPEVISTKGLVPVMLSPQVHFQLMGFNPFNRLLSRTDPTTNATTMSPKPRRSKAPREPKDLRLADLRARRVLTPQVPSPERSTSNYASTKIPSFRMQTPIDEGRLFGNDHKIIQSQRRSKEDLFNQSQADAERFKQSFSDLEAPSREQLHLQLQAPNFVEEHLKDLNLPFSYNPMGNDNSTGRPSAERAYTAEETSDIVTSLQMAFSPKAMEQPSSRVQRAEDEEGISEDPVQSPHPIQVHEFEEEKRESMQEDQVFYRTHKETGNQSLLSQAISQYSHHNPPGLEVPLPPSRSSSNRQSSKFDEKFEIESTFLDI